MSDYFTLKVKEVVKETTDSVTIHFKQPLFKKVKYKPGQFLTLIVNVKGQKLRRSYSMCSAPNLDNTIAVTVKRVQDGIVSNFLNDNIKAGDSLEIMKPMGHFVLEPNKTLSRDIVLFAAGSGITPLMSILKSTLFFEPNSNVSLVYGNRHEGSIIFRNALDQLKDKFGARLNLIHCLSKADSLWEGYQGRIDSSKTVEIVQAIPNISITKAEYFMCGPEGMMHEIETGLASLGVDSHKIHHESFITTASTTEVDSSDFSTKTVTVILEGEEHTLTVPPDKSILDTGLDEGLDMPFSCQSGLCTACMGKCKSGEIKMTESDGLSEDEKNEGYVLLCVGHPLTDNVVVEI